MAGNPLEKRALQLGESDLVTHSSPPFRPVNLLFYLHVVRLPTFLHVSFDRCEARYPIAPTH